jgi:hypothetical protein
MERMDADGSQYIRVHPSRSVFYSREFRVIARAGRKVSHPLDGRNTGIRVHISPGARASCPQRHDAGGTPAHPGDARAPRVLPLTGFFGSPCMSSVLSGIRTPKRPLLPLWGWGMLTGVGFWGSLCVSSTVSGIRTPRVPLLPLWEKGAGGMRGKSVRECRTSLISPKKSTLREVSPQV